MSKVTSELREAIGTVRGATGIVADKVVPVLKHAGPLRNGTAPHESHEDGGGAGIAARLGALAAPAAQAATSAAVSAAVNAVAGEVAGKLRPAKARLENEKRAFGLRRRGSSRAAGREASPEAAVLIGIDRLVKDVRTGRFEQTMAALTAAGAAITAVEIFSEHDGASFGNKMMWLPVVIVPTAVPVGIASVFSKRVAKTALPLVSTMILLNGLQGTYLHWRGIAQKPGGLKKNLRYNVEMGPPVFAPLLACMVGGMGILAAVLRREGE